MRGQGVGGSEAAGGSRLRELDAIRGIAALSVVMFHYTVRYTELFGGPTPDVQWRSGALGVQVFFGISGFVIFMTLSRARSAGDFLISRFSRLYPAYWACALMTLAVLAFYPLPGREVTWWQAAVNLTMWQELLRVPHIDGVYWSLQVELIFYALALLVFATGQIRRARSVLIAWLLLALTAKLATAWLGRDVPYVADRFLLLQYSPYFAIGAATYLDFDYRRMSRAGTAVLILAPLVAATWSGVTGLCVTLGMDALFVLLVHRRAPQLGNPLLVWFGTISYPLYLLHQNIGYVVIRALREGGWGFGAASAAALLVSVGLAALVTTLVEQPALRWIRARLRRGPTRGLTATSAASGTR